MKSEIEQINPQQTEIARLQSETEALIRASIAPNTMKAYRHALEGIQTYLSDHNIEFSDNTLAAYITYLHGQGRAPASISVVVAAARWQLRNENKDYDLPVTTRTLAGIRRDGRDRGRGQVTGLDWQQTERVCAFAESENTIVGLRDSAMIRLMSDCLLRVSEVVAVDVSDFEKQALIVRTSKTDQEGVATALYVTTETQNIIEKYQKRAGITSGALFCRIRRGDHIQPQRLTVDSARRIIKKRAEAAGVEGFISGHSLRVGSAVALAQAGASVVEMQVAGRWKSAQMPAHYAKSELAERGAIAKYKEKQKSKGS
ncbi:tyrosine-type recombinase/integrase [Candidatus Poribacteria bacterium]|nr:tyrosine-type recombinase/integrase [Candidatus Poribacteria bacterium]